MFHDWYLYTIQELIIWNKLIVWWILYTLDENLGLGGVPCDDGDITRKVRGGRSEEHSVSGIS